MENFYDNVNSVIVMHCQLQGEKKSNWRYFLVFKDNISNIEFLLPILSQSHHYEEIGTLLPYYMGTMKKKKI